MKSTSRAGLAALLMVLLGFVWPASAGEITCPDGFVTDSGASGIGFNYGLACAGHMTPSGSSDDSASGSPDAESASISSPQGEWVYDGPVCDNAGMCASNLLCADGTPMVRLVFIDSEGNRGEVHTYCPGEPGAPPVPAVRPPTEDEIITAFREVVPPKAELVVQPPGGKTLVNFRTIFSTQAEPFDSAKMELVKGFNVQFHVYPVAVNWKFGDGAKLTTKDGGQMWEKGDNPEELINHIYTSKDPVKASVVVTWGADVSMNGGTPETIDATVNVTSPNVPLEILEATPQLVAPPS